MLNNLNSFKDKRIAIIPARGGSTRIKNKNLRKLGNKSLILNSIMTCKKSGLFDEIIVSTDSVNIANESRKSASIIHKRSEVNSSSIASTESVISEVMNDHPKLFNEQTLIYLIQCTAPFLLEKDLIDSFNTIKENQNEIHCLISGYYFYKFIWEKNTKKNSWEPINYKPIDRPRSQDKSPLFIENGAFYVFGSSNFKLTNCRIHGKVAEYAMEELRSMDIDEEEDLKLSRFLNDFLQT